MNSCSHLDDGVLVAMLNRGDRNAFEAIYDRYADMLYRYIYNRVRSKEISEEIIQELFVSLWTKRDTLIISVSLQAYLYTASKYKVLTYIRSNEVRKKYAADFVFFMAERFDNSTQEFMELKDLQLIIEETTSRLPDKCQTAFRMSRMEHEPIKRIAQRMNISTRTVENYISQALKHLRISLGKFIVVLIVLGLFRD